MLQRKMFLFLLVTSVASTIGMQGWATLITNFAVESAGLDGGELGWIHSLREVPGFLSLLALSLLFLFTEHGAAALTIVVLGAGLAATGLFPSFAGIALTTLVMSTGFHFFEPLNQSLGLQYFDLKTTPMILGRLRAASAIANIAVGALIFLLLNVLPPGPQGYAGVFGAIGLVVMAMGLWALRRDPSDKTLPPQNTKMIVRKKYWLYYALTFLSGARRQIFMVFSILLLVQKFKYSAQAVNGLFVFNNMAAYFANPLIGKAINAYGERRLMRFEYATVVLVFVCYAFTDSPLLAGAAYIIDQLAFNFVICIRTYLQKIAEPRDIRPSSAVGFTVNHIAAVFIPAMGGFLWTFDYRIPFLAGAALALVSLYLTRHVRLPDSARA